MSFKGIWLFLRALFLLSLVKYAEPQSSSCPSPKQREFIKKIKVPGFKTVYYFDDGEYNCTETAMNLFIVINSKNMFSYG